MASWLHWIGKAYYTQAEFIAEAREQGITRRVSLSVLSKMRWGDMVCCIARKPGVKAGSVFLEFPITLLSGLSPAAWETLACLYDIEEISPGGEQVERE